MSFSIDYEVTAPVFNIQSYSIHDGFRFAADG